MSRWASLLIVFGLLATGCDEPITVPAAGDDTPSAPAGVGLEAIKARGTLRVLTRNNGISYFVWHGHPRGFDYELAELFAESLGVTLEIIVPQNWGDLLRMLEDGSADVAAAGITVTEEREKDVRFAPPYTLTHMRVVWGRGARKIASPEALAGRRVHVRSNSAYFRRLQALSQLLESTGKKRIDIVLEGESLETEQIIEEVAAGRIPYTLCDDHICRENAAALPELVIGPRVSDPQQLAWAVHPTAEKLADSIATFFDDVRRKGRFEPIFKRYYERPAAPKRGKADKKRRPSISTHDAAFKAAGKQYGVDWRLLAALAYQQSGFDPRVELWTGGRGLFGLLPTTARQLGITKLKDPKQASMGASRYLARLEAHFAGVRADDERLRMTLAAFNCGVGHVTDARLLATGQKLDANTWEGIAGALRLLARPEHFGTTEHGYVRGGEVATFVDQVWNRYRAYRHATGVRDH